MKLTNEQIDAVNYAGKNLQLIACAGSGKTEVVARRVVNLLDPDGSHKMQPENIIAFTFTEKAAAELKERIVRRTRERYGLVPGLAEMFVGTIHAFCLELLMNEVPKYLKFEVLNQVQQSLFIDRNSRLTGLTTSTTTDGIPLRRYTDTQNYISAMSILREADVSLEELAGCTVSEGGLFQYQRVLEDRSFLDYSSILSKAKEELSNNEAVRSRIKRKTKYVIVDEYQDVNPVQESIVSILGDLGAGICVVGDDDQTIYQWRGSDVDNIVTFSDRYPDVKQITLDQNFRSSEGVVSTAQKFIEQNPFRLEKLMTPAGSQQYQEGDIVALAFDSRGEEAEYIASTIQSLAGIKLDDEDRGISWSDMAILLRSVKNDAGDITKALREKNIPFIVTGMTDLFGSLEADAARKLFLFLGNYDIDICEVEKAWLDAEVGIKKQNLSIALDELVQYRTFIQSAKRWEDGSIQRVFLNFLNRAGIREEHLPSRRVETVFYNLGKFSELISDFETIHYKSVPLEKYEAFCGFLSHGAENAYPEGWQENEYASPDAVRIMTVHQAKGMQWPVVFLPALLRNRFPARKIGGRTVWHLLPKNGVERQSRFEGSVEDERRLFYVAMTRSKKFLHMTWAPVADHSWYQRASEFWENILVSKHVIRRKQTYSSRERLEARPPDGVSNVIFSFSELKYFFECPYQFKLRVLCGFNAPIAPALGYGKSLHDTLADVHARAIRGEIIEANQCDELVETHLNTPYASTKLSQDLKAAAQRVIRDYIDDNKELFEYIEFSEQSVEIHLNNGIVVNGRIDLVRRLDTNEVTIVDLKSSERAQPEAITEAQLHTYALGYQELTGKQADYVEIYNLDERKKMPRSVDAVFIENVKENTKNAADCLRKGNFDAIPEKKKCAGCDYLSLCSSGQTTQ